MKAKKSRKAPRPKLLERPKIAARFLALGDLMNRIDALTVDLESLGIGAPDHLAEVWRCANEEFVLAAREYASAHAAVGAPKCD